jgi:ATP-dependent RNA helicase DDX10/DBP4
MFATDIAARGLDFKDIAWVIQFDCPENEDTYIHRVGRTARYASEGHAILFAMPSEAAMLEKLEKRKVPLEKMKVNPTKTMSIRNTLQGLLVKEPELKYLAQKVRAKTSVSVLYLVNFRFYFKIVPQVIR